MANVNIVILVGNMTRDVELSYLPSQTAVASFGLAINRKWKTKENVTKEEVCFVECQAFAKLAENLNKYVHKGDPLFVEGRLKYEHWEKDGIQHSRHKVIVENFQFLSHKPKATEPDMIPDTKDGIPF